MPQFPPAQARCAASHDGKQGTRGCAEDGARSQGPVHFGDGVRKPPAGTTHARGTGQRSCSSSGRPTELAACQRRGCTRRLRFPSRSPRASAFNAARPADAGACGCQEEGAASAAAGGRARVGGSESF
eukprot:358866-Chlamydomonas_euryale.AAC.10